MTKSNLTVADATGDSFGTLCHILLVLWFTAFLIMLVDVLLLRDAWIRSRNRASSRRVHAHLHPYYRIYGMEMVQSYEEYRPVMFFQVPRLPQEADMMEVDRGIQYIYQRLPNGDRILLRAEQVEEVGARGIAANQVEENMLNER